MKDEGILKKVQKWIKGEKPRTGKKKSRVSLCRIFGRQSGTGTGSPPSEYFSFPLSISSFLYRVAQ
jgi:hypothetical protein